jgi:hypothetical protein
MVRTTLAMRAVYATLAAAGFALAGGCSLFHGSPAHGPGYHLQECPQHWDSVVVDVDKGTVFSIPTPTFGGFALTREITDVPEFHDCQKLLLDRGTKYGPLVAVFAAYDLDSLERRLDLRKDSAASSPEFRPTALAAGLILNLDSTYSSAGTTVPPPQLPLEIRTGFSCLYVWRLNTDTLWHAGILPVGNRHSECLTPRDPATLPLGELKVIRDAAPRFTKQHYPAVARWEWDDTNKQQYIGIQCGPAWCQIGSHTFRESAPWLSGDRPPSATTQVQRIKGWYDEQFLAVRDGSGVKPSTVRGIVFPDTSLKSRSRTDYHRRWLPVAYVALSHPSPYYVTKFNFDPVLAGAPLSAMNTLSFCYGTTADCFSRFGIPIPKFVCPQELQPAGQATIPQGSWWVKIEAASGSRRPMFKCAVRTDHSNANITIPPTSRWRWLADDETMWKECLEGCCRLERK